MNINKNSRIIDEWSKVFETKTVFKFDISRTPSREPSPLKLENDIYEEEPDETGNFDFMDFTNNNLTNSS